MAITHTILAIVPGARETGFAVFRDEILLYYGVMSVRNRKTSQNVANSVGHFCACKIKKFSPDVIAIEKRIFAERVSSLLSAARNQLHLIGDKHKILIHEYEQKEVIKALCQTGKQTKRNAKVIIVSLYPEIAKLLKLDSKWERQYYANLFDAIALGTVCARKFVKKQKDLT